MTCRGAALAATIVLSSATASADADKGYEIFCWDGSFAYTIIGLKREAGRVSISFGTQDLRPLFSLGLGPQPDWWGVATIKLGFDEGSCTIEADALRFRCRGERHIGEAQIAQSVTQDPVVTELVFETIEISFATARFAGRNGDEPLLLLEGLLNGRDVAMVQRFSTSPKCGPHLANWHHPFGAMLD